MTAPHVLPSDPGHCTNPPHPSTRNEGPSLGQSWLCPSSTLYGQNPAPHLLAKGRPCVGPLQGQGRADQWGSGREGGRVTAGTWLRPSSRKATRDPHFAFMSYLERHIPNTGQLRLQPPSPSITPTQPGPTEIQPVPKLEAQNHSPALSS